MTRHARRAVDLEYYPTPAPFTRWLFDRVPIIGTCYEPCVGDGAIIEASRGQAARVRGQLGRGWRTNDLDERWRDAQSHLDATTAAAWSAVACDWVVTNPPFGAALAILDHALRVARIGVAMHLRASIHEVLKTGPRRTWMAEHRPTGILWLPRFAYQRSRKHGTWTTDSVCACWVIWIKQPGDARQFIDYAPVSMLDEIEAFTPGYRSQMDARLGLTGTEAERQAQCVARWKEAA